MSAISNIEDFKKEPIISQVNDLLVHYKQSHDELYKQKAAIVRGELEELTKLRAALDESIKVIEFYGDKSNYAGRRSKSDIFSNVVGDNTIYPDRTATGGRRAREFLSKHKELIKGEV
ncbi:MAG: hypothetical protein ACK52I_21925 [Pseudomonadota bacterium]